MPYLTPCNKLAPVILHSNITLNRVQIVRQNHTGQASAQARSQQTKTNRVAFQVQQMARQHCSTH